MISRQQFRKIMQYVKETERIRLEKMPEEVQLNIQSGYLLGYADCWSKINEMVEAVFSGNNKTEP